MYQIDVISKSFCFKNLTKDFSKPILHINEKWSESCGKFSATLLLVCRRPPFEYSDTHILCYIKHLMTGPEGNIEIRGKQNELFPEGSVIN